MAPPKTKDASRGTVHGNVQNHLVDFTVRARPLPNEVTAFLTTHIETLKRVVQRERELTDKSSDARTAGEESAQDSLAATDAGEQAGTTVAVLKPADFWKQLEALFLKAGKEWQGIVPKIWAFGPRRVGPNILVDGLGSSSGRS